MFVSKKGEIRHKAISDAIRRWNRDFAPAPFYRQPSTYEVAFLAGLTTVKAHEVKIVLESIKEELQHARDIR